MKKSIYLLASLLFLIQMSRAQEPQNSVGKAIVIQPCYFDISPPLREAFQDRNARVDKGWKDGVVVNHQYPKSLMSKQNPDEIYNDPNVQRFFGSLKPDTTTQNFDGTGVNNGVIPPDPAGDVGPNHYVQVVNLEYAIYSKTGTKLLGPFPTSQLWSGMPNNSNSGDAVALYDEQADRWLISQFSLPNYPSGPFYQMVAISQTADPTGAYYRYQYSFSEMPDYPKIGVWSDAYYICVNRFDASGNYLGPGAGAFDRSKMLAGTPTSSMIFFPINNGAQYHGLPSDCDGTFPPSGTPGYFTWSSGSKINLYEFHADWTTPSNSTFVQSSLLSIIPFSTMGYGVGVPQKGTTTKLDPMSAGCSLMNRLQFRKFSDHWSMVTNGTVNVGNSIAGIRWYEFRKTGSDPWTVYQQATYAPNDGKSRWCGSIAMDTTGNIALAYNITSPSIYPSLYYTGRMSGDALNTFSIAESGIINGGGCQTNTWSGSPSRWGDYTALTVDPSAPSTFWYTAEYYSTTSQANWKTRIAAFSFANFLNIFATATPSSVCAGQSSQLNATVKGGTGNYTYSWTSVPPGFTSNIHNPVVTPVETTRYVLTLDDGTQTKTDTLLVTFNEPLISAGPDTSYNSNVPLFPCFGTASNYSHLKWSTSGDGHFNFDTVEIVLYYPGPMDRSNGGVQLQLKGYALAPCIDSITDQVFVGLGNVGISKQEDLPFRLSLLPNPTKGVFVINITGAKDQQVSIIITDIKGLAVYERKEKPSTGNFMINTDLTSLPKGTYIVKVQMGKEIKTQKLVLQ